MIVRVREEVKRELSSHYQKSLQFYVYSITVKSQNMTCSCIWVTEGKGRGNWIFTILVSK